MKQLLFASLVTLLVSLAAWFLINRSHGLFEDTEVLAEGRDRGGFTQEMFDRYKTGETRSAIVSLAIWGGLIAGASGAIFWNGRGSRFWVGLLAGLVLGALAGVLAGYLTYWHSSRFEYRSGAVVYWSVRISLLLAPLAVAVAVAASLSAKSVAVMVDYLVSSLLAGVLTVAVYVGLMGVLTPQEDHTQLFPVHSTNRLVMILCFNLGAVLAVSLSQNRARSPNIADEKIPPNLSTDLENRV